MNRQSLLSVIVPVYGCVNTIEELCSRVIALETDELGVEVILVDDSSIDGGKQMLLNVSARYDQCRPILLPRNFGQHWATSRGILDSKGDQVVIMDCDLENRPEDIPKLLAELSDSNLCVLGSSTNRGRRTPLRRFLRGVYGRLLSYCYRNDLIELGFNSFSFAAFDGRFVRDLVAGNSPYDPISIKTLDSGAHIKVVQVETSPNNERGSSYSVFENLLLAFKSLLLAGKGFQILCIQSLACSLGALIATLSVAVVLLRDGMAAVNLLLLGAVSVTLLALSLAVSLSLLVSVILSSLSHTRPLDSRFLDLKSEGR